MLKYSLGLMLILNVSQTFAQYSQWDELRLQGKAPNYAKLDMWAAHPDKPDSSDLVPARGFAENTTDHAADVFFIYPTIYRHEKYSFSPWYADVYDSALNAEIDNTTIKFQASVFNESCRVFSPRYRQAHLDIFKVTDQDFKDSVLLIAYEDIREAFQYYLSYLNEGRPFIIAAHSQGTIHAGWLLREFVENTHLQKNLIAAYLVGMPVPRDYFTAISPCEDAAQTGCFVTWNTYARGYTPDYHGTWYVDVVTTNPLNWRIDDAYSSRNEHLGGLLRDFNKIYPRLTDAQNHNGMLWIRKPYFPGRLFVRIKRYHVADYNLFYFNIKDNAKQRVVEFLKYDK